MRKRSLSESFLKKFYEGGKWAKITSLAKYDSSLDFEMRGNCIILYYRGGKILQIYEDDTLCGIDSKYAANDVYQITYPNLSYEDIESYISKAKSLIDKYQIEVVKNLGEKEIQQRVVYENNQSVNSEDNDYFIADIEWEDNKELGGRADIVAFKWNHTSHYHRKVKLAIIEVKQGESSIRTGKKKKKNSDNEEKDTAGLKKHYDDFLKLKKNKEYVNEVSKDMLCVLHQKYKLGLVNGLKDLFVDDMMPIIEDGIDFIFLLANYKPYSMQLRNELEILPECKFFIGSFMGYVLYKDFIIKKTALINMFPQVKGFKNR